MGLEEACAILSLEHVQQGWQILRRIFPSGDIETGHERKSKRERGNRGSPTESARDFTVVYTSRNILVRGCDSECGCSGRLDEYAVPKFFFWLTIFRFGCPII